MTRQRPNDHGLQNHLEAIVRQQREQRLKERRQMRGTITVGI